MKEVKSLIRILEKEARFQEKLLRLLTKEQVAITKMRKDELDEIAEEKEKLFIKGKEIETERNSALGSIKESIGIDKDEFKISDIIETCRDTKIRAELSLAADELRKAASATVLTNDKNQVLLEQSLGLVLSTISIIRSSPGNDLPSYNSTGGHGPEERAKKLGAGNRAFTRSA